MFGYIKPFIPELKVKQHELYRSVYCGLCKCMGRTTRPVSRLTLSYDFVFLAVFRMALTEEKYSVKKGRCMLNPFKKRPIMENNSQLEYCSRVCTLLNYYSLLDKKKDKGNGKLKATLIFPLVKHGKRKITGLEDVEETIEKRLSELDAIEQSGVPSPDRAAQTFGELVAYVLSRGLEGRKYELAKYAGLCVGRFIYLADAADDYEKDVITGDYNPFVGSVTDIKQNISMITDDLLLQANGVYQASLLLDYDEDLAELIGNTAEYGMPHICKQITDKILKGKVE